MPERAGAHTLPGTCVENIGGDVEEEKGRAGKDAERIAYLNYVSPNLTLLTELALLSSRPVYSFAVHLLPVFILEQSQNRLGQEQKTPTNRKLRPQPLFEDEIEDGIRGYIRES